MYYVVGAFAFGLCYSVAVVYFYRAVNDRRPLRAAGYDLLIGSLTVAPFQFWALSGNSAWVLASEVAGSALGTYLTLKWGRV
jgi:hypothetical protein